MAIHENIEKNGCLYPYHLEGYISIGDCQYDLIIQVTQESNLDREEVEYLNSRIQEGGDAEEEAGHMFMTAISDTVAIPTSSGIKTIEVKSKHFEAGLPGLVIELGNCIKIDKDL